jgi:hypothetical protein
MSDFAVLRGFCRRMPDVCSFVVPVFADAKGKYVAQDADNSGRIASFQPIDTSLGFERTEFHVAAKIGGPVLHGFETSDAALVLGSRHALARFLCRKLEESPDYRQSSPGVARTIDRFVESSKDLPEIEPWHFLVEFSQFRSDGPYIARAAAFDVAPQRIPETPREWSTKLVDSLSADHERYLDAHQTTVNSIEALTLNVPDREAARADLGNCLADILENTRFVHPQAVYGTHRVCPTCLFKLVADYPTPAALNRMMEVAERVLRKESRSHRSQLAVTIGAVEAIHAYLDHAEGNDFDRQLRDRHLVVLDALKTGRRYGKRAQRMFEALREPGKSAPVLDWDTFVGELDQSPQGFDDALDEAQRRGQRFAETA